MKKLTLSVVWIVLFSLVMSFGISTNLSAETLSNSENKTTEAMDEEVESKEMNLFEDSFEKTLTREVRATGITTYSNITGSRRISDIFPDPALAVVVAQTLGYGTNVSRTVNQNTLNTITLLSADSVTVSSIEGIQYLNNATKISFQDSKNVTSLSPLAGANLTKLKQLYLKGNKITDLTPLSSAGLTSLEELYLEDNQLKSLTGIENITSLKKLSFQNNGTTGNEITSLDPVAKLTNLEFIWGKDNKLTSLKPLANLSKLKEVYVESNQLTSIVGMENKPNLISFSIMYQQVEDLTPIANSLLLENLFIRENNISSVEPLKNLTKLKQLLMETNHVIDISPLSKMNFTTFSALSQTRILPTKHYSSLVPFELSNLVKTKDGSLVTPSSISDNGTYKNPIIEWQLATGMSEVTYLWKSTTPSFSGTIIQPLEELPIVEFTIGNTIVNHPNPNEAISYTIKMVTSDGKVISPSKNGLPASSTDATVGTFSLKNGETLTLKTVSGAEYTVVENVNTSSYTSLYSSIHDTTSLIDQTLPENKTVKGVLSPNHPNKLDFINRYKAKLVIDNSFVPKEEEGSATYDIVFTYPDGSTSEERYHNLTIKEGQPFEEMIEVGTTYQIVQREIVGYEPSASQIEDGQVKDTIVGSVSSSLEVSGEIFANENRVSFQNVQTEQLEVTLKDISKYPNINQAFNYVLTLSRPNIHQAVYEAKKYQGSTLITTYEVDLGQPSFSFSLKDGEKLVIEFLPVDTEFSITQTGVASYLPEVIDSPNTGTITGGGRGNDLKLKDNMATGGNLISFINQSDYIPPTTGIKTSSSFTISFLMLGFVILLFVLKLFAYKYYHQ